MSEGYASDWGKAQTRVADQWFADRIDALKDAEPERENTPEAAA